MKFTSEIYLIKKNISQEEWQELINTISTYNGYFKKWQLIITFENNKVRYFSKTHCSLPASINNSKSFILKSSPYQATKSSLLSIPLFIAIGSNAVDIKNYFDFKGNEKLSSIEITLTKISDNKIINNIIIKTTKNNQIKQYKLLLGIAQTILSINFESNYNLTYKSAPKYLDISKCLHLLKTEKTNSILSVDTFPYLQGEYYLDQNSINFNKHSIVFGSSGCGKSKFLSLFINNIYQNDEFKNNYKVVVIDPHASLEKDIGGIGRVVDFKNDFDSINLFSNNIEDAVVSVELLLDVFKGLIPNNYNSKLERVLRHSLYLLLTSNQFNFKYLRKLLTDLEYRNTLIKQNELNLPMSIIEFFLSEFNEIKTRSYTEAISPIIALIDEMEMIPVFNKDNLESDLKETINNNFLTIFSLNRTKLGDKVTKTISGLVMQQLLTLVQNYTFDKHVIFIVDEVAVIENPILNRFLSEARKYNLSLVLAGQYFGGISSSLQSAIFANVINYYIFRISSYDANILADNLNIKIPLKDTKEQKVKLLTELQDRECLVRINGNGYLLPIMKCQTLNFESIPRTYSNNYNIASNNHEKTIKNKKTFSINTNINLKDILISNSTSRKVVEK